VHGIWDSSKTIWWVDRLIVVIAKQMQRRPPYPKIHTDSDEKTQLKYPLPLRGNRQTRDNWEQVSRVPPVAWDKFLQLRRGVFYA